MISEITENLRRSDGAERFRAMFVADWREALFIHFPVDAKLLQPLIPLPLDLREGRAYVSLVAFTQERLRLAVKSRVAEILARPLAHHEFLNLRTYVTRDGEPGIYFLGEWIPNRLAVFLGPRLYGLPHRFAQLGYHTGPGYAMRHAASRRRFSCVGKWNPDEHPLPCAAGSDAEFLLERYTAYTFRRGILRRFRIAHEPWRQNEVGITVLCRELLEGLPIGDPGLAHYSPGVRDVRISWRQAG